MAKRKRPELASVGKRLGKAVPWFEKAARPAKEEAVAKRRAEWKSIPTSVPVASPLLSLGEHDEKIQALTVRAARASATIKVNPPSSRSEKTGQPKRRKKRSV